MAGLIAGSSPLPLAVSASTGTAAGLTPLAVFGALASVVSAYYYLRIIKVMWFDAPKEAFDRSTFGAAFVVVVTALVVAPGILFLGWLELAADIATRQF